MARERIPHHSKKELNDIAVRAQGGDPSAKEKLMEMMRPYVVSQIRRIKGDYTPDQRREMEQAGYVGVLIALGRFDVSTGVKFSTYAYSWIKGEIDDWMATNSGTFRLPRTAWMQARRVDQELDKHFTEASDKELVDAAQTPSAKDILRARQAPYELMPDDHDRETSSTEDEVFEGWEDDRDQAVLDLLDELPYMPKDDWTYIVDDFCRRWDLDDDAYQNILTIAREEA